MSKKQNIVIIDYKTSNLNSIYNALSLYHNKVIISSDYKTLYDADKIILPGVGNFGMAMDNLNKLNLIDTIKELAEKEKFFLGICLGMQLMMSKSEESSNVSGLSLIPGEVKKMEHSKNQKLKFPHIGWNEIHIRSVSKIIEQSLDKSDFYFVHSYHVVCDNKFVIATTPYGKNFNSIIQKENFFGCQFHPEKSLKSGLKLLRNFVEI